MQSLQKLIDKLKSCENTKFPTLEVTQGNFEGDQIIEQNLLCSEFKNSTLKTNSEIDRKRCFKSSTAN